MNSAPKGNIAVIFVVLAASALGILIYLKSQPNNIADQNQTAKLTASQPTATPVLKQTKTFQSKNLKFSIVVPANFQVEEKFTRVTITAPDGLIYITRSGTNFSNLDDYLYDLENKNHFNLKNRQKFSRDSLTIISGFKDKEKEYFIFVDNWVYLLSTSSESLFDDLDQIAQSFKYIPEK